MTFTKETAQAASGLQPRKWPEGSNSGYDFIHYGLQPDEVAAMVERAGNRCEICGRPPVRVRLNVDHCHLCGGTKPLKIDSKPREVERRRHSVRGLLCVRCNRNAFRDDPVLLRLAAAYFTIHHAICPARLKEAERAAA